VERYRVFFFLFAIAEIRNAICCSLYWSWPIHDNLCFWNQQMCEKGPKWKLNVQL